MTPSRLQQSKKKYDLLLSVQADPEGVNKLIERITELETQNAALEQETEQLRHTLIKVGLQNTYHVKGAEGVIEQAAQTILQQQHYLNWYSQIIPFEWTMPPESSTQAQGKKWDDTEIIVVALFRDDASFALDRFIGVPVRYPGPKEAAVESIISHLALAVTEIPLPGEWAGTVDGLNTDDLSEIFRQLTPFHRHQPQESFREHRSQLFNEYWPKIQAAVKAEGLGGMDRGRAQRQFNQVIERTFANVDSRRSQVQIELRGRYSKSEK